MGIDRIGKGGAPPVVGDVGGASKVGGAETPFSVDAAKPAESAQPAVSDALARLRAGEIDVNGYVDARVDEATRNLALPPTDLADLKSLLREQLVSDPSLADLVTHAAGRPPTPPEE